MFNVRSAQEHEAHLLREIERLGGERFREVGLAEVADDEPPSVEEIERLREGWSMLGRARRVR